MAKEYFEKLTQLISDLKFEEEISASIEVKHYFSGAALYVNGTICASWSPSGLAFKLPEAEVTNLISTREAKPLKYFKKGNTKKGYALFEAPDLKQKNRWRTFFIKAAQQV